MSNHVLLTYPRMSCAMVKLSMMSCYNYVMVMLYDVMLCRHGFFFLRQTEDIPEPIHQEQINIIVSSYHVSVSLIFKFDIQCFRTDFKSHSEAYNCVTSNDDNCVHFFTELTRKQRVFFTTATFIKLKGSCMVF